jgi:protease-4
MDQDTFHPFRVFFRRFFITVGVLTTLFFLSTVLLVGRALHPAPPKMPDKILLTWRFKTELPETRDKPSLSSLSIGGGPTFREVADAVQQAAKDPRVKGFAARLDGARLSLAQEQELRDAVRRLRKAGKFAYVWTGSFESSGMGEYYLASGFDRIWLQPVGALSVSGVAAEIPFARELLDKVGARAQFSHKGIYKSMPESLTLTGMSAPHREMMTSLVNDLAEQMEAGICAERKIAPADFLKLVDRSPLTADDALRGKLIDHIGYSDEMLEEAKKAAGVGEKDVVSLADYDTSTMPREKVLETFGKARIALITGTGDIVSSARGTSAMAADDIVPAFRAAAKDKDVAAIVFRVDSPGGSPEASESIRHALLEAKKKGKPVVVSMGGYAASGGYWVSAGADKIVAEPGTITGSIGVFGGKIELSGLWRKIGLNWDSVAAGKNALMWSMNRPFTPEESARADALLGVIYDSFLSLVSEGRHMPREKVAAVAEGRVWTGRQAKERGLVDELGGIDTAIIRAKQLAKLDPEADIPVVEFPEKKSPFDELIALTHEEDGEVRAGADLFTLALDRLRAQTAALRMPYVIVH